MAWIDPDGTDAPVCPLLGLTTDRRSHFTYPHPGHRCFAKGRPASTDASRQARYCLSANYTACDRFAARQTAARAADGRASSPGSAPPDDVDRGGQVTPGAVIHVLREGDSLARIATSYGLTVEQIAAANGLAPNAPVAPGTRLVIPLARR